MPTAVAAAGGQTPTPRSHLARRRTGRWRRGDGFDVVLRISGCDPTTVRMSSSRPFRSLDEHLDARPRARQADLSHRVGHDAGAAIGQVIASDHGHHRVLEAHSPRGLRHATRFVEISLCRPAGLDGAEAAVPADAAEDRRMAVPRVQHSPWFGQRASSQTVCNASSRNSRRSPAYVSLAPIRTLSHLTPSAGPGVLGDRFARGRKTVVDIRATGVHHVRRCMVATSCSGVRSHHRQFNTCGREISRHRSESSEGRD